MKNCEVLGVEEKWALLVLHCTT